MTRGLQLNSLGYVMSHSSSAVNNYWTQRDAKKSSTFGKCNVKNVLKKKPLLVSQPKSNSDEQILIQV